AWWKSACPAMICLSMATHAWFTVCHLLKTFVKSSSASMRNRATLCRSKAQSLPLNGLRSFGGGDGSRDESRVMVSWVKFSNTHYCIQSPTARALRSHNLARLKCSNELSRLADSQERLRGRRGGGRIREPGICWSGRLPSPALSSRGGEGGLDAIRLVFSGADRS